MKEKYRKVFLISSILLSVAVIAGIGVFYSLLAQKTITYKNPVGDMTDIGDPFVLKTGNSYYMYATSEATRGFKVWKSNNLVSWEYKGLAYDHYEQANRWATGDFWAPEVIKHDGMFYMVYSARNNDGHLRISIATSKDPLGPFKDTSVDIIKKEGSYIDGDIFIDNDGTPYLYYVKDNSENIINGKHVSQIYVQKMDQSLTQLIGQPQLLITPDQQWEGIDRDFQWNEGPFVLKHDKRYYLMYSANFYASADYAIGYAVSDHPMGPFKKAKENPILSKDLEHGISGPGHNSVTLGPDGENLYIIYHTHTYPNAPSGLRQMYIDRLFFEDGRIKIEGPTYLEQEIRID
ncbi:glycoside hydrolase family 43 protein [Tepidibacillus infernus]|uniref:glycoside hydrolase family 43 protein n=1 Tax=Tepidibacillus infernus TaxID=1806172 RepID=UPI003B68B44D